MFESKVNPTSPTTGKMEWIVSEKDYNCIETDVSEEFSRFREREREREDRSISCFLQVTLW